MFRLLIVVLCLVYINVSIGDTGFKESEVYSGPVTIHSLKMLKHIYKAEH